MLCEAWVLCGVVQNQYETSGAYERKPRAYTRGWEMRRWSHYRRRGNVDVLTESLAVALLRQRFADRVTVLPCGSPVLARGGGPWSTAVCVLDIRICVW